MEHILELIGRQDAVDQNTDQLKRHEYIQETSGKVIARSEATKQSTSI